MRGRKRTPTAILLQRGSRRAGGREDEPRPDPIAPRCPSRLPKAVKIVFRAVCRELTRLGVIARCDGAAIERYSVMLVEWVKAAEFLDKYGQTYTTLNDEGKIAQVRPFPQVGIVKGFDEALRKTEAEFGLTPASRARLHRNPGSNQSDKEAKFFAFPGRATA
jgi:P27 family predicted phage terminase small subunit